MMSPVQFFSLRNWWQQYARIRSRLHYYQTLYRPATIRKKYFNLPRVSSESRVVVSLTTTPLRIHLIEPTLLGLMNQTVRPDEIILNIPSVSRITNAPYPIPDFVRHHPVVTLNLCDQDLGPATKLLPTLKKEKAHPDAKIIVVDDDAIFSPYLIESMNHWADFFPESAVGNAGFLISRIPPLRYPASFTRFEKPLERKQPVEVDILFGFAAYCVRPRFLDDRIFDYTGAPRSAFFEDDFWLSGHLMKQGIKRILIPGSKATYNPMPITLKPFREGYSLSNVENKDYQHSIAVFEYLWGAHTLSK